MSESWRSPKNKEEWEAFALLLARIGYYYKSNFQDFQSALPYYERAYAIHHDTLKKEDNWKVAYYVDHILANIYTRFGDHEKSEALLKNAVRVCLKAKKYSKAAGCASDLGIVYEDLGQWDQALELYEEVDKYPDLSPRIQAILYHNWTNALLATGQVDAAHRKMKLYERIIPKVPDWYADYARSDLFALKAGIALATKSSQDTLRAVDILKKQAVYLDDLYPNTQNRELGKTFTQIAELYASIELPDSATHYYWRVISAVIPGQDWSEVEDIDVQPFLSGKQDWNCPSGSCRD